MKKRTHVQYKRAAVIVHGKSELLLASYIYTNLHLPVVIISNENGKSSIQINGLQTMLSKRPYNSLKSFADRYSIEYDKKSRTLKNFRLFTIMDTDDCSEQMRKDYISGRLFDGCCLKDYIIPIYDSPNLEEVMIKSGIMIQRIQSSEKSSYYSKVFPINQGPVTEDTIEQIRIFSEKVKGLKETNILQYVNYCLSLIRDV